MKPIDRWFVSTPDPHASVLLFCLPYAGGGASAYRHLARALPPGLSALPVQLPGREGRIAEPADFTVADVADAVTARADRPYAIYGHSMGGRLGFEVVRELRRRAGVLPYALLVGASRPPDSVEPLSRLAHVDDATLIDRLTELGGVPPEVFEEPELRELVLPVFRADFGWIDRYQYVEEDPLPVPVVAIAGTDDLDAPPELMAGWARHTSAGFEQHVLPGGHLFMQDRVDLLAAVVAQGAPIR